MLKTKKGNWYLKLKEDLTLSIEYRGENKWRFRIRFEGRNYSLKYFSEKPPKLDKNGKLPVDKNGETIYPADVKREHSAFEVDVQRGEIGLNGNMTFEEFCELYTNEYVKLLEGATQAATQNLIDNHFLPYFKNMKIDTIKTIDIQMFFNKKSEEEYEPGKKYKASSLDTMHSKLKAIFNKMIEWNLLKENPCKKIKYEKPLKCNHIQIYDEKQLSTLMKAIDNLDNLFYKFVFSIALFGGFREGEMHALTIKDIDFKENSVNINKQYTTTHLENKVRKQGIKHKTKSPNSTRVTYLPMFLMKIIHDYIKSMPYVPPGGYLFWNFERKKIYDKSAINYAFKEFLKRNDLPHISVHKLRDLNATMLIKSGSDVVDVAKQLGDTVKTVSDVYIRDIKESRKKSMVNLENYKKDIAN